MNSTTAATITTIFPIILLTLALDRERISPKLRKRGWFRKLAEWTASASIFGMLAGVIWLSIEDDVWLALTLLLWFAAAIAWLGLAVHVLAIIATAEVNDEEQDAGSAA